MRSLQDLYKEEEDALRELKKSQQKGESGVVKVPRRARQVVLDIPDEDLPGAALTRSAARVGMRDLAQNFFNLTPAHSEEAQLADILGVS
ncbi:unnamed protein product [Amoebophrya sp. A25]|nr:unnamed protein product [Amoebophrya sp. A25]|eukprot:GSA25T00013210001.1